MNKPIVAIMYDFDKTLSTTDMQNYSFIPKLEMTSAEFWQKTSEFSEKTGVERILSYMYVMISEAKKKGIKVTREYLRECGKNVKFYPGVLAWFKRINEYGKEHGVIVEHYLVSSGTREIVEGCKIFPEFTEVYGCEYYYNDEGEPIWPKHAINYTQKTQFFFRVAKGATDINDDKGVNEKSSNGLRIPMRNIIYMGDGMTDIACMTLVKKSGGRSIAIYEEQEKEKVLKLYKEGRVNYICPANYEAGSKLEKVVQLIIDYASVTNDMDKAEQSLLKS